MYKQPCTSVDHCLDLLCEQTCTHCGQRVVVDTTHMRVEAQSEESWLPQQISGVRVRCGAIRWPWCVHLHGNHDAYDVRIVRYASSYYAKRVDAGRKS